MELEADQSFPDYPTSRQAYPRRQQALSAVFQLFAIPTVKRLTDEIESILYRLTQEQVYGVWIEEVPVTSYQQKRAAELGIL